MAASIPPVVALVSLAAILLATDSRAATALVLTSIALVCVRLVSSLHSNGRLLRAVSRAERTYRELVDTSQDVIWTVDTQGRMVFSNPAAEQLFGYSPEEMIGRPFALLLPGGVRAGDLEAYREVLAGSGLSQHQTQVVRKDGTERTVLINATPRRDAAGAVIGMTGTATDISARVETEQERERLQARAGEVERLEALGRLVGGIAHDYNNLTAVILNYAAFVRDEVESEAVRADVAEIQIAAGRAADLTRQLLIFSSHHQQLDLTVVDANEAIEQMGALLRRTIGEDIDLQLVTASEPARVELGPGQLDQVLMNLALNARDALPAGGRLTFAVELGDREPSGERSVKITARDTGSGIPPEHLTRLFEPFFTTKATGTGLGLATVHGIVRHAGGDVAVESEPGRGTTFTVELPEAPQGDDPPAEGPPRGDRDSHDATILIVEDEPGIRRVADRILTAAGYRTMCAANGAEAIAIAEHHEFDLLLTDVIMPGITGVDCARAVESLHPGIAVLLMSGYTDDVISRSTFGDPAPALLQKPFSAAQLESAVRQQLLAKLVA